MRILLVEDEKKLADALEQILKKANYLVDVVYNGEDGQAMAESGIYDVIVLDRMLPLKNGVDVLKGLRNKKISTPVIFLTAKDTIEDRVEGLDAGADDYLVKPFFKDELLARVRALGRRSSAITADNNIVTLEKLSLDPLNCLLTVPDGDIKLTVKEAQLLELLMRNKGITLTKEQILDRVWGFDDVEITNVDLYVFYLRKKINFSKYGISLQTVRGIGYYITKKQIAGE